jgi:hypothetical protein
LRRHHDEFPFPARPVSSNTAGLVFAKRFLQEKVFASAEIRRWDAYGCV